LTHKARKRFGQNFLHDPGVIARIVSSIHPKEGELLVEIGPGQGAITQELLRSVGSMHAVELDRDLLEPLAQLCGPLGELTIHSADALKFDFSSLSDGRKLRVVGNLPYNISTPILFHLLEQKSSIADMHFMLQKEVVERMAADPGSKTYGRLSVMLQAWCEVTHLFDIGPGAFNPPPKVDSAFVRLVPYEEPPHSISDPLLFARLVTAAFSQRRKTLRNNMKGLLNEEQIEACGISPSVRSETLTVEQFLTLANLYTSE
jgi:16S rRNA (adenine1518-N6/adenine1519-N6)-dimethyltransferase